MGFKPEKVAELVSRTFNEMIFIHGDVHCDPHAANLFLRKNEATGQLQLVLLDHGLYRQAPAHATTVLAVQQLSHCLVKHSTSMPVVASDALLTVSPDACCGRVSGLSGMEPCLSKWWAVFCLCRPLRSKAD